MFNDKNDLKDYVRENYPEVTSKAAVCRTFNVKRTTLYDALGKTETPMADLVPS
jgi:hypothetical protein